MSMIVLDHRMSETKMLNLLIYSALTDFNAEHLTNVPTTLLYLQLWYARRLLRHLKSSTYSLACRCMFINTLLWWSNSQCLLTLTNISRQAQTDLARHLDAEMHFLRLFLYWCSKWSDMVSMSMKKNENMLCLFIKKVTKSITINPHCKNTQFCCWEIGSKTLLTHPYFSKLPLPQPAL